MLLESFKSKLDSAEERIKDLKDNIWNIQPKEQKGKKKWKRIRKSCAAYRTQWKERIFALWNSTLTLEKEMDINDIKAIVAENFPNLKKELDFEIHEA